MIEISKGHVEELRSSRCEVAVKAVRTKTRTWSPDSEMGVCFGLSMSGSLETTDSGICIFREMLLITSV
ncbi:hypothetical protein L596_016316 [Steinernema carpocapsae]|uniref:Uncharacterized protein n=1 Tax=Steinernema carpocapsae TaxID=34508 RepID=A0A4U5NI90_STECR|nr:hypothetical protein L596_016316 [Steinernema carpocapsae]